VRQSSMHWAHHHMRVLGIDPCTRGFGFAVLEGGSRLIDWGVARLYSKNNEEVLVRADNLIKRYSPSLIALEDVSGTNRGTRAARQIDALLGYARHLNVAAAVVTRQEVRQALGVRHAATKHEIATMIAKAFPELEATLPRVRRPWETEKETLKVFDAVAIAITADPAALIGSAMHRL